MYELSVGAGVLLGAAVLARVFRARTAPTPRRYPGPTQPPPAPRVDHHAEAGPDETFIEDIYGDRPERSFYTTIAGVSYPNADGTSRISAICRCHSREQLKIFHDSGNAFSSHCCLIAREEDGAQLGYLPDRIGAEVLSAARRGIEVVGFFGHRNQHPDTNKVVGASILLVFLRPQL
jgi:hypothetical protein